MDNCSLYRYSNCSIGIDSDTWPGISVLKFEKDHLPNYAVKAAQNVNGTVYPDMWFCCTTTGGTTMPAPFDVKQYPECNVAQRNVTDVAIPYTTGVRPTYGQSHLFTADECLL